jgi:hypothetical protein
MSALEACGCMGCATQMREIVECLRDLLSCVETLSQANSQLEFELVNPIVDLEERLAEIKNALAPTDDAPSPSLEPDDDWR